MATGNWHEDVFFGIHYDLHANATDTELGRELTPEHLRERLERVRPDWIQCDCKGHPGYTSWPTEVGTTSPGVVRDALRIHRDVTRELGIRLGMHYSGVIDQRALELHPEWGAVNAKGERSARSTCRLSPYADELMIPQMLELVRTYDVDGFWVDGENWGSPPCWCDDCRTEFTRRTGMETVPTSADDPGWEAWLSLQRDLFTEYVSAYADRVHEENPACLICSNWMYTIRQPEPVSAPVDYLSGDYTPNWGAARAALEGRMLDCRDMTWDLMVWGFTRNYAAPGSPWAMKPAVHLCQEVAEVVALGGAVMVYAKPHRTGWLTGWEHDIIADVADFCRARKDVCFKSRTASETAVLHVASHYYTCNHPLFNYGKAVEPIEGALNALLETHRSTDILTEDAAADRLDAYKLIIVPEQTRLAPGLQEALTHYAAGGGHVLLTGAHLATEAPELVGCTPAGDATERTVMLPVGSEAAQLSGVWQGVTPATDTEVWGRAVRNLEPDQVMADDILLTCRRVGEGAIAAVHGPLFRNYFCAHFPRLRQLVDDLVGQLDIAWDVELEGPPQLELVSRTQDHVLMLNLINRGSGETLSPQRSIVTDLPAITDVVVHVRTSAVPTAITVEPDGCEPEWSYADGRATIMIPSVPVHSIVAIRP